MNEPTSPTQFDELIHSPLRLRACAALATMEWVEFARLRETLQVADSVLSKHLKTLETAGYVRIERFTKLGRSRLRISLTAAGRVAYTGHVAALRSITGDA
ncbi:transcriptional regulator [Glutamicibacter sp. PS]|uniref:transcriptional regulator n=1 Tax=Glutamicibacter sp. PS TaxID=3075634 RepID=UPI00283E2FC1|nr:transcriptional regulator [Glutamicibacter sp. PS]MDR4533913.1 transcriptional regulator [Glutamicibacter sp. PS]